MDVTLNSGNLPRVSIVRIVMPFAPAVESYCRRKLIEAMPAQSQLVEIRQSISVPRDVSRNLIANYLAALNQCDHDIVFMCEYDCLYHQSHFVPALRPDHIHYIGPGYYLLMRRSRWRFAERRRTPLSSLAGNRDMVRDAFYRKSCKVAKQRGGKWRAEFTSNEGWPISHHSAEIPWIDIRHGENATFCGPTGEHRATLPYWGDASALWREIEEENKIC